MNRHGVRAFGLAAVLVLGVLGGTGLGATAPTATERATHADTGPDSARETAQNETISIVEAMEAAATETADRNGTVVGAELGQTNGLLDFGDDETVYTVDVLLANGTHIEVGVNATNGSVLRTDAEDEGFLEDVFDDDEVPDRPLNLSAMYNATEAVQFAQDETDANGTVTAVNLDQRDDALVYEVQFEGPDDGERTVVVAAMRDGGGVVETETDE